MSSLSQQLFRRKPVVEMEDETGSETGQERTDPHHRAVPALDVRRRRHHRHRHLLRALRRRCPIAGPAVIWSFVIAGVVAGLTAVCYAELASAVPVSGSSYSYAYATLGELPAMVVAGCLLLEYGVSGAAVAVGWSQYLNELLDNLFGFQIPEALSAGAGAGRDHQPAGGDPDRAVRAAADPRRERVGHGQRRHGDDQDRRADHVHRHRHHGLELRQPRRLRAVRVLPASPRAAGIIFFSYIGLDAVSTAGEEVKNPHRTMPLAIMIALVTVTALYIVVAPRRGRRPAVQRVRGPGGRPRRDPGGHHRVDLAGHRAGRRRGDLDLQRHPGRDLRPDPHPVRDGPRRHDPRALPQGEPAHPDAGPQHDHRGHRHRAAGRASSRSTSWPR